MPASGSPLAVLLEFASKLFHQALAKYEEQKPHHEILHQSFLLEWLQDPMMMDAQHAALSKMVAMEWKHAAFCWIKALKETPFCTNISQVEIIEWQGPWLLSIHQAVEQALCQLLKSHFTKAHGSPFKHLPLLQDVGFLGCSTATKEILEKSYQCPPKMDELPSYLSKCCSGQLCIWTSSRQSWTWMHFALIGAMLENSHLPHIWDCTLDITNQWQQIRDWHTFMQGSHNWFLWLGSHWANTNQAFK